MMELHNLLSMPKIDHIRITIWRYIFLIDGADLFGHSRHFSEKGPLPGARRPAEASATSGGRPRPPPGNTWRGEAHGACGTGRGAGEGARLSIRRKPSITEREGVNICRRMYCIFNYASKEASAFSADDFSCKALGGRPSRWKARASEGYGGRW